MAATRTPKPQPEHNLPTLSGFEPKGPFGVAFSAGADSTALLWACAQRWPLWVRAIHVNHGLQQAATDFEWHARHLCARLGIPCVVEHAQAHPAKGQSPEDAARIGRYAALAHAAKTRFDIPLKEVWLAQHADDQAESVLLAWSRGAGLAGLAAMPEVLERDGVRFVRPWLGASGAALRSSLRLAGVPWVEDPSNESGAYTRNRIRREVLPVLEQALPGSKATLVRTARHAAQSLHLLADLAAMDGLKEGEPLKIADLRQLPAHRLANVLRHWLAWQGTQAQTAQMDELLRQVSACQTRGHRIHLKVGAGHVIRQGEVLAWLQSKV